MYTSKAHHSRKLSLKHKTYSFASSSPRHVSVGFTPLQYDVYAMGGIAATQICVPTCAMSYSLEESVGFRVCSLPLHYTGTAKQLPKALGR